MAVFDRFESELLLVSCDFAAMQVWGLVQTS